MTIKLFTAVFAVVVGLALAPMEAAAFGGGNSSDTSAEKPGAADFAAGRKAVDAGDYQGAVKFLSKAARADPKNADSRNLLGFSYRKLGDVDAAFEHYHAALAIDRKHRGANEYIGELYLELGDLAKAEEHLKVLDGACFFGCEEYSELKQAIAGYKVTHGS